jgi:hypothetical protein
LAVDTLPLSSFFSVEEKVNKKGGRKDLPALSIQRPPAHSLYIVNISPFTVRSRNPPPPRKKQIFEEKKQVFYTLQCHGFFFVAVKDLKQKYFSAFRASTYF